MENQEGLGTRDNIVITQQQQNPLADQEGTLSSVNGHETATTSSKKSKRLSRKNVVSMKATAFKLPLLKAIGMIGTSSYIQKNWIRNFDDVDVQNDIVSNQTNVGIISALLFTVAASMFTSFQSAGFEDKYLSYAYALANCLGCIFEACALLLCIRNITLVQITEVDNINGLIYYCGNELILPQKLNTCAVFFICLAFLLFFFDWFGVLATFLFIIIVCIPMAALLLVSIGRGIQALNEVQQFYHAEPNGNDNKVSLPNMETKM